jgi:transcriptional regulator NrdR family protein
MFCPYCRDANGWSYKTKVLDTRSYWNDQRNYFYLERRRECPECERRFTTIERSPKVKHEEAIHD